MDTDHLLLPGGMTLEEFRRDVRHGKAGGWLSPDAEDALRSTGGPPAQPEGASKTFLPGLRLRCSYPRTISRARLLTTHKPITFVNAKTAPSARFRAAGGQLDPDGIAQTDQSAHWGFG